ncbi:transglutaminase domain-containing protein [Dokdonia sp.]|uniref:transglutaminase domain-containing protein n=1 Tax=Dokdonia sp. TaxID=2024995 RepID=UPI003266FBCA
MQQLSLNKIKQYLLGIALCYATVVTSQDFEKVDATVSFYPNSFITDQALATQIKKDFTDPKEQLRAGYSWLINNVAYDPQEYYTYKFQYRILEERNEKMAETREGIINRTVQNGIAVCEGYALTLERVCELLGINAYVVRGDTKTQPSDIGRPFDKNHMWLVAIIDKKPMLLDPTWGAGRYNGTFIKSPSYAYFDTPASQFLKSHYPEIFDDAYVFFDLSKEEFSKQPLLISEQLTIDAIHPKQGILKSKMLSKGIVFSLPGIKAEKITYTLDTPEKISADFQKEGHGIQCTITAKTKAQSLVIYADDIPIIAYKIKK